MEEAHIVVDLEASPSESMYFTIKEKTQIVDLEASLQRELDTLWGNANEAENFTIFRTPHNISQSKKYLFQPSVISIGPFHHGKKHLQALEEQKMRFLRDFLSRGDHISLDLCIKEMKLLETGTRRCYSEMFDDLDSNAFVKMMLLDGCFVLQYFLQFPESNSIVVSNPIDESNPIAESNSIVDVGWNSEFINCDLLLLENQIPFFIVKKLYEIAFKQEVNMNFVNFLVYIFAQKLTKDNYSESPVQPPSEIHHLVHLCYHCLVPNPNKPADISLDSFDFTRIFCANSTKTISSTVIPSATELKQKGLKFTPKENPKHILDISFENGVLKIPRLQITDDTKPIFANLIAFEHSKYGKKYSKYGEKNSIYRKKHSTYRKKPSPFTTYVAFLDNLVNTQKDVTILQDCKIIENWLGSEEEVTNFINQVTECNVTDEDHYLTELYTEVNKYSESSWNRHRAKLIRDYFSSPWTAISLVAALILLVLTCVQSFYAVYVYKFPPSS